MQFSAVMFGVGLALVVVVFVVGAAANADGGGAPLGFVSRMAGWVSVPFFVAAIVGVMLWGV